PQQAMPQQGYGGWGGGIGGEAMRGSLVAYGSPEYAAQEQQWAQQQQLMQEYRNNPYWFMQGSGPGNSGEAAGMGGAPGGGFGAQQGGGGGGGGGKGGQAPSQGPSPSVGFGQGQNNGLGLAKPAPSSGIVGPAGSAFGFNPGLMGVQPGWGNPNGFDPSPGLIGLSALNPQMSMDALNAMHSMMGYTSGYDAGGNGTGGGVSGGGGGLGGGGGGGYGFGIGPGPGGENSV